MSSSSSSTSSIKVHFFSLSLSQFADIMIAFINLGALWHVFLCYSHSLKILRALSSFVFSPAMSKITKDGGISSHEAFVPLNLMHLSR